VPHASLFLLDPQIVLLCPCPFDPQIVPLCPLPFDPQIALPCLFFLYVFCLQISTSVAIWRCGPFLDDCVPQNELLCVDSCHIGLQSHSHLLAGLAGTAAAQDTLWEP
jgi:hypothetical protein